MGSAPYGLRLIKPAKLEDELTRRKADLFVVNTNGVAGIGNFDTGHLSTATCAGVGDAFRIDRLVELDLDQLIG